MTKIVGARIDQYVTCVARDYGGSFDVTAHRVTIELHATKGWRVVAHQRWRSKVDRAEFPPRQRLAALRGSSKFIARGGIGARKTGAFGIQPLQVRP